MNVKEKERKGKMPIFIGKKVKVKKKLKFQNMFYCKECKEEAMVLVRRWDGMPAYISV